jgi:hypothetical protein
MADIASSYQLGWGISQNSAEVSQNPTAGNRFLNFDGDA